MVQYDVKRVSQGTESFMVSFDMTKTPITQVADCIIIAASQNKASDIHFDPREDGMMVRFRIDGDLQDYTFIQKAYERNLTTRLKLLANMNITESRLPQDGAIKGNFGQTYLDMRVSCLPLNEGEKIVIRILDYTRSLQGIDSLGFNKINLEKLKRMMLVPNGIILVTGATGSGKSTTTYSILQALNKPETNIITVEDPIEMNIQCINQVQVNAEIGMTFAAALRSILRQDPNIILIGEIRDSETAQIAVRASITGHLVLSTIHTNNSLSTIERLLDMDVERYLLSTALTGIISQRLAKQLCTDCRYQRETTKYEKKVFKRFMNKDVTTIWDANPKGCEHCRKGYHGRIAIQEVLELDDDIRNALNNEKLEKEDLRKMVYTKKTITMLQDALGKALEGITSFEEVYRVIEIELEADDTSYEEELNKVVEETAPKEEIEEDSSDDLLEIPKQKTQTLTPLQINPIIEEQPTNINIENTQPQNITTPIPPTTPLVPITTNTATTVEPIVPTTVETQENIVPITTDTATVEPIVPTVPVETQENIVPITEETTATVEPIVPTTVETQENIVPITTDTATVEPIVPTVPVETQENIVPITEETTATVEPIVPTVPVETQENIVPITEETTATVEPIVPTVPVETQKNIVPITEETTATVEPIVPTTVETQENIVPITTDTATVEPIVPTVPVETQENIVPITEETTATVEPIVPTTVETHENIVPITTDTATVEPIVPTTVKIQEPMLHLDTTPVPITDTVIQQQVVPTIEPTIK